MPHTLVEFFLWLCGLVVGSFLNVVIYRLPAGVRLWHPPRSFCPHCRHAIAWYDNVPLLSWCLLRGRCRHCRAAISVRYPLVEGLTGLIFVLLYHLLFIEQCRADTGRLQPPADLPLLLSWLALAAGLVVCSAMDLTSYTVDVRVTHLILTAGIIMHACWPRAAFLQPRAASATVAAALAAFVVGGWLSIWAWCRWGPDPSDEAPETSNPPAVDDGTEPAALRRAGYAAIIVAVLLPVWLISLPTAPTGHAWSQAAVGLSLAAVFAATVVAGGLRRVADEEIRLAIEAEQPQARLTAWRELLWLSPAILAAAGVLAALWLLPSWHATWERAVGWSHVGVLTPLAGAAWAIYGAVVGAAAGWLLRIVFTLTFGREAFGVGDIHILAAAGAAAGWDVVLLGLLFSIGVALAGWLVGLLLKSTAMIPFGPWLALGFVLALWWNRPAHAIADSYRSNLTFAWQQRPDLLLVAGGLLLVGMGAAIALARLVRRWIVPDSS